MYPVEIVVLIVVFGLLFDYTNGFHDAANVVSTVIATRALRPLAAIILAGILNTLGATQIGGVAKTITTGLVEAGSATQVMILCALIGAIAWNIATWYFGIPSSSSYALIGGLVGAALVGGDTATIIWRGLLFKVIIPMIVSPVVGFVIAYVCMKVLYRFIGKKEKAPLAKLFRYCQIGSAGLVALAHGLNDAQKSMGIITLGLFAAGALATTVIPLWVILACALTIGLGTAVGGFRIIHTLGFKITKIAPAQGFIAEMSASFVILTASFFGMPISSTNMIVGSVAGVGSARGARAVEWGLANKLISAWALTIPGAGLVAAGFYLILNYFNIY